MNNLTTISVLMVNFSQLFAISVLMSLLVPHQPSAIAKATEVWDVLPGCSSLSSDPLSKCYDTGKDIAQNSDIGLKITIKDDDTRKNIIEDQKIKLKEGKPIAIQERESISFNVCLESQPSSEVEVTVTSNDDSIILSTEDTDSFDSNTTSLILIFTPENWYKHQVINTKVKNSHMYERDKEINIELLPKGVNYNSSHEKIIPLKTIRKGLKLEYTANKFNFLGRVTKNESISFNLRLKNELQNQEEVFVKIILNQDNLKLKPPKELESSQKNNKTLEFSSSDLSENQVIEVMLDKTNKQSHDNDLAEFSLFISSSDVQNKVMLVVTLDSANLTSRLINPVSRNRLVEPFLESLSYSDEESVFIRPELSVEKGESSFLRVKLKTQPESEDKTDIIFFDRNKVIDFTNPVLKFNSNNWDEYQEIMLISKENKNDSQADIVLVDLNDNYNGYLNLMNINVIDDYELPPASVILTLAVASILGLQSISSILKLTNNASDKLSNVFELISQARRFLKEGEDRENLQEKFDEINIRLENIENKIDRQSP